MTGFIWLHLLYSGCAPCNSSVYCASVKKPTVPIYKGQSLTQRVSIITLFRHIFWSDVWPPASRLSQLVITGIWLVEKRAKYKNRGQPFIHQQNTGGHGSVSSEISDLRNIWLHAMYACTKKYSTYQIRWENWWLGLTQRWATATLFIASLPLPLFVEFISGATASVTE